MDPHHNCLKLFVVSLPLFCLLSWSWCASSTTTPPPPSSALLAVGTLRTRGYSLFASVLVSLATTTNFSGTILAPPDFAFSFATAKFFNNRRPPPRPSTPLLLYHTLRPPLILTWAAFNSRDDGEELRTVLDNNCLYFFRSPHGGEVSISSSPFKNPLTAVKIRQPDLYVDDHLTVHGIDGVLDPSFATKCSVPNFDKTAETVPLPPNRILLDHAMRTLRRNGYNVVAAAMAVTKFELLSLTSVTVFAVSDEKLFLKPGGSRYDFRHHVLPVRHRFADLANSTASGTVLDTLAPNKTVVVYSVDGAVTVDGVPVNGTEVYHDRWMVVVSIPTSLDDLPDIPSLAPAYSDILVPSQAPFSGNVPDIPSPVPAYSNNSSPSQAPFPGDLPDIPSPALAYSNISASSPATFPGVSEGGDLHRIPSSPPAYIEESENITPSLAPVSYHNDSTEVDSVVNPSPAPWTDAPQNSLSSPTLSPATNDLSPINCDLHGDVLVGVEEGDLFCPATLRQLRETDILHDVHMEESRPLDAYDEDTEDVTRYHKVKIDENVNIADDIFFYV